MSDTTITGPLTFAAWDALRFQASRDTLPLIVKLAVHHGHTRLGYTK